MQSDTRDRGAKLVSVGASGFVRVCVCVQDSRAKQPAVILAALLFGTEMK